MYSANPYELQADYPAEETPPPAAVSISRVKRILAASKVMEGRDELMNMRHSRLFDHLPEGIYGLNLSTFEKQVSATAKDAFPYWICVLVSLFPEIEEALVETFISDWKNVMFSIDNVSIDEDHKQTIIEKVDSKVRTTTFFVLMHASLIKSRSIEKHITEHVSGFFEDVLHKIKRVAPERPRLIEAHVSVADLKEKDAKITVPKLENTDAKTAISDAVVCAESATPLVRLEVTSFTAPVMLISRVKKILIASKNNDLPEGFYGLNLSTFEKQVSATAKDAFPDWIVFLISFFPGIDEALVETFINDWEDMMVSIDNVSIDDDHKRKIIRRVDENVATRTHFIQGFVQNMMRRFLSRSRDFSIEKEIKKQVSGFFGSVSQTIKRNVPRLTRLNEAHLQKVELKKKDAEVVPSDVAVVCAESATPSVETTTALHAQISTLSTELESKDAEIAALRTELENKKTIITTMSAIMGAEYAAPSARLRTERAAMRTRITTLRTGMETSATEISTLRTELAAFH